jgi:hypothetical protein
VPPLTYELNDEALKFNENVVGPETAPTCPVLLNTERDGEPYGMMLHWNPLPAPGTAAVTVVLFLAVYPVGGVVIVTDVTTPRVTTTVATPYVVAV